MFPFLIALVVFIVAGIAATALLRKLPATSNDAQQGLAHLAELHWRDFAKLVLQAMRARGYAVVHDEHAPADSLPTDGGEILLQRGDNERVLLSCKYGNAAVVGVQAIQGLGQSIELRGAQSAIVVTPGRFDKAARQAAGEHHVELIDGAALWPEVKPFAPESLVNDVVPQRATGKTAIAWVGAAAIAAVTWMLAQGLQAPIVADSGATTATPAATVAPRLQTAPLASQDIPTDSAVLEKRRSETANAISTLPGVDRAIWSTQSTLLVYLSSESADPSSGMCPLLERYAELAASRVQLQPPQGSEKPVRFKQCRSY